VVLDADPLILLGLCGDRAVHGEFVLRLVQARHGQHRVVQPQHRRPPSPRLFATHAHIHQRPPLTPTGCYNATEVTHSYPHKVRYNAISFPAFPDKMFFQYYSEVVGALHTNMSKNHNELSSKIVSEVSW
jgi:hypothetical protein